MRSGFAILLVGAILLMTGCGREPTYKTDSLDLVRLLHILPTQSEFTFTDSAAEADLDTLAGLYAPGDDATAVRKQYESLGFRNAAIRRWEGPDGAKMTVALSRWRDRMVAVNTGGGVAEVVPIQNGAVPWTPDELRGSRGARTTGNPPRYSLSYAVENVGVYVETSGPVSERTVVRTMQLIAEPLRQARDS